MNKDVRLSSAIHILIALYYVGVLDSKKLAMSLQTNPGLVRRLLAQLSKAKLIVTEKGKGGGSRLAKDPRDITIGSIYLAIGHNRVFKSFEKKPFEKCHVSCCIKNSLDSLYEDIEGAMFSRMQKITLNQMIKKIK